MGRACVGTTMVSGVRHWVVTLQYGCNLTLMLMGHIIEGYGLCALNLLHHYFKFSQLPFCDLF